MQVFATMESNMTTRTTVDAVRTQEPEASLYKGTKARALFSTLLGCISWLPLASAAEAAPFQRYLNGVCPGSLLCTIDFPTVQAGKRLEITNVSCYARVSGNHNFYALQLLVFEGGAIRSALTLRPRYVDDVTTPFQSVYSANHSIFAFANAGQRFQAYAELEEGTFSQFACSISGQMENI
jgi:hypothetical protein